MSTATTEGRPKTDPFAELDAAREQLDEARQERARLGVEARQFETEMAQADAELGHLAQTSREMFDGSGQPRPKTQAAKLRAKLDQAGSSKWPDIIGGADERVRVLENKVHSLTDQNAVELARREYRGGEDDLVEIDGLAEQTLAALSRVEARRARLIGITASCRGRIDGRDVLIDQRLDDLRRLLTEHGDFKPPRARTLTPLVGEMPAIFRSRDGGWISAGHGSDNFGEQPPRIEAGR